MKKLTHSLRCSINNGLKPLSYGLAALCTAVLLTSCAANSNKPATPTAKQYTYSQNTNKQPTTTPANTDSSSNTTTPNDSNSPAPETININDMLNSAEQQIKQEKQNAAAKGAKKTVSSSQSQPIPDKHFFTLYFNNTQTHLSSLQVKQLNAAIEGLQDAKHSQAVVLAGPSHNMNQTLERQRAITEQLLPHVKKISSQFDPRLGENVLSIHFITKPSALG